MGSQPEAASLGFLGRYRPWATREEAFTGIRSTPNWEMLRGTPKREKHQDVG